MPMSLPLLVPHVASPRLNGQPSAPLKGDELRHRQLNVSSHQRHCSNIFLEWNLKSQKVKSHIASSTFFFIHDGGSQLYTRAFPLPLPSLAQNPSLSIFPSSPLLTEPQIPLEDEHFSRSYNTGIPSTAPPSFQTVPPSYSNSNLPHRNDETAATVMPREERLRQSQSTAIEDPAISIWAPSDHDLEAAREDTLARLIARVEALERRTGDVNASSEKETTGFAEGEEWSCGGWTITHIIWTVIWTCFVIWACAMVTLWAASGYRRAGIPQTIIYGSAGDAGTAGNTGNTVNDGNTGRKF